MAAGFAAFAIFSGKYYKTVLAVLGYNKSELDDYCVGIQLQKRMAAGFAAFAIFSGKYYKIKVNPLDHIGLKWHRPVVLPLPRAGGSRCSVKPASRCALHFRDREPLAFAKGPWPNSWLGMGKPVYATTLSPIQWTWPNVPPP
ncbi:hypothetical protein Q3G72_010709 [Acer saccharum]|nr:hypothetical protein Q3G72_010709 [Acer saccharum]